jgi:nitrite transporter NirC
LLAFIASGYEHSVANMTLLSMAVIGRHAEVATLVSAFYNLAVVTIGNVLGGAVMVGGLYWLSDARDTANTHADSTSSSSSLRTVTSTPQPSTLQHKESAP